MILWLLAGAGAWGLARGLGPYLLGWSRQRRVGVTNYRGQWVPWGLGLAWILAAGGAVAAVAAGRLAVPGPIMERLGVPPRTAGEGEGLAVLAGWILWAGLVGWMDDLLGDRSRLGFRGHVGAILRGELTTGGVKLVLLGGGALAAAAAAAGTTPPGLGWLAAALLMALTVNAVNLLDLRPGRALKGSLGLLAVSFLADPSRSLPALPGLAAALAVIRWDLKEEGILGDAGANALGALAGWSLVQALPPAGELVGLALLAGLHLYAERSSLSEGIEGKPFLKWLDRLGRLDPGPTGEGGGAAN